MYVRLCVRFCVLCVYAWCVDKDEATTKATTKATTYSREYINMHMHTRDLVLHIHANYVSRALGNALLCV